MVRAIIAVIVSYILMFVLEFVGFTCLYLVLGADFAFKPGLFLASNQWVGLTLLMNLVISTIGGLICATIARGGKAPLGLAAVVIVLGVLLAFPETTKGRANANAVRPGTISMGEVVQKAHWPVWVPFTFPFAGAIGVLIGGRLKRKK